VTALSRAALMSGAINARHASPSPRPVEILQIGKGVFLGFVDWMVDVANKKGVYAGGVVVAAPRRHERPPALATQDGLYTVLLRGRENGADVSERRIVTAIQMALDPYPQWGEMLRLAPRPS
jgi:tagaturonate reductase